MKGWLGLGVVSMASLLWCADANVEFNRDVRPILSEKCFTCHGPDAAAKKVPFRLDSENAAKAALEGGEASKLVRRVTAAKALRMPPAYSGLKLTVSEIDMLRAWVRDGAKWEKHWSFIP